MRTLIRYVKLNWWRFTPDSWLNWYHYWKGHFYDKIYYWRYYQTKPWENNSRCAVCGGTGQMGKYNSYWNCDDCNGTGQVVRHWESKTSRVFKCIGLRINNKIKKNP